MKKILFLIFNYIIPIKSKNTISILLGIIVSTIPLILVSQVSGNMVIGITLRFIETSSYHLHISLKNNYDEVKKVYNNFSIPYMKNKYLEKRDYAILGKDGSAISYVRGFDELPDNSFLDVFNIQGSFDISDKNIVLGEQVAKRIRANIGDIINIVSTGSSPKIIKLKVSGIVKTGYMELDKLWSFTSIKNLSSISKINDYTIGIKIENPFILPNMVNSSNIDYDYYTKYINNFNEKYSIKTWYNSDEDKYANLINTQHLIDVILFLIIAVSVINTTSGFILMIVEKDLEISYLRCLGLGKFDIFFSFLVSIFLINLVGTLVGDLIASVIFKNINSLILMVKNISSGNLNLLDPEIYLENIPLNLDLDKIFSYTVISIMLSSILGIIPSIKSLSLSPIEIIKK